MNKYLLFACFIIIQNIFCKAQETFPVNGVYTKNHNYYAFTNAKIVVDYQTTIDRGTLLIKDGLIIQIGNDVKIPSGAVVLDLKGKNIYPSLIDLYTSYGMPEIKRGQKPPGPQIESNTQGAYHWNQAVKPETDASKLFTKDEKAAEELRKLGYGAVLTSQKDGIVRGTATFVTLIDNEENESIISDKAAALYSFDKGASTQGYPSSLMGSIALLRQTYYDAQWYKNNKEKKNVQTGKEEFNLSLEAFNNLQTFPQIFEVNDKLSALRADKLGDEFKVQYLIKGAGDEYQRLEEIKNTHAKYIIPLNFPSPYEVEDPYDAAIVSLEEMKHWEMAPANPAFLEKKGISFAFTASDTKNKGDFWKNIRKSIKYGLTEKQALKALTYAPAEMLGLADKVGSLKVGMIANFIITSSTLFDEKNIIYQNWVRGVPYFLNDINAIDIRATYELKIGENKMYDLKIDGEFNKPKASVVKDTIKSVANIVVSGNIVSINFKLKGDSGTIRLSGMIAQNPLKISGKGQLSNGDWINWVASYKEAFISENKKDSSEKEIPQLKDVIYPFTAYGKKEEKENLIEKVKTRWDAILIKNVTVWTNEPEGILKGKDVYITEGRIVSIGDSIRPTKGAFAKIIDGTGKHLTPGIIDEHSHIAISNGVNEGTQSSSAEVRIGDVINSEDVNIYRQLSGGVVACQLLHGSANPIGGQSAMIKLRWGKSPEEMKIKNADGFIKFALGENVKQSNWGELQTVRFPQSRMGVEQVYYDHFIRAKEYETKWKAFEANKNKLSIPRKDLEMDAIIEILNKKRFITCHSYVQSEINMLMHVGDSMGFKINTFTHILEGYKIADKLKSHGAGASTFADWWAYKIEVMEAIPYNAALLNKMEIVTAVNSDDAEMGRRLNQEAAKAIKYGGISEEEALKLVTLNPAKLLHLDNKMGSIKPGKDADIVLWSDHPLSVYAKAEKTLIDGIIYYDNEEDLKMREEMTKERARLIQKMIAEKNGGEKTQAPKVKKKKGYHCDSMEDEGTTLN